MSFSNLLQSLLLLNYLVRNGSERVVTSSREHVYDLRSLENYTFVDENGKDQGINVRHKVKKKEKEGVAIILFLISIMSFRYAT